MFLPEGPLQNSQLMHSHSCFLLIDAGMLAALLTFLIAGRKIYGVRWKSALPAALLTATVFVAFEIFFVHSGIRWFNADRVLPFRLLGLPLEDWLFFLTASFFCHFAGIFAEIRFPTPTGASKNGRVLLQLSGILLLLCLLNYHRTYSFLCFGGGGLCLVATYVLNRKFNWIAPERLILTYGICILPVLIVDLTLTASQVVMFNEAEITGLRLYTIPLEDLACPLVMIAGTYRRR